MDRIDERIEGAYGFKTIYAGLAVFAGASVLMLILFVSIRAFKSTEAINVIIALGNASIGLAIALLISKNKVDIVVGWAALLILVAYMHMLSNYSVTLKIRPLVFFSSLFAKGPIFLKVSFFRTFVAAGAVMALDRIIPNMRGVKRALVLSLAFTGVSILFHFIGAMPQAVFSGGRYFAQFARSLFYMILTSLAVALAVFTAVMLLELPTRKLNISKGAIIWCWVCVGMTALVVTGVLIQAKQLINVVLPIMGIGAYVLLARGQRLGYLALLLIMGLSLIAGLNALRDLVFGKMVLVIAQSALNPIITSFAIKRAWLDMEDVQEGIKAEKAPREKQKTVKGNVMVGGAAARYAAQNSASQPAKPTENEKPKPYAEKLAEIKAGMSAQSARTLAGEPTFVVDHAAAYIAFNKTPPPEDTDVEKWVYQSEFGEFEITAKKNGNVLGVGIPQSVIEKAQARDAEILAEYERAEAQRLKEKQENEERERKERERLAKEKQEREAAARALQMKGTSFPTIRQAGLNSGGVCDVCNNSISLDNAYVVPNNVFYASQKYRQYLQNRVIPFMMPGANVDTYIMMMKMRDTSVGSAVCQNCIHMFK